MLLFTIFNSEGIAEPISNISFEFSLFFLSPAPMHSMIFKSLDLKLIFKLYA